MQSLRCCLLAMQRDSSSKQADETADEREARHESAAAGLFRSVVAEATGGRVSISFAHVCELAYACKQESRLLTAYAKENLQWVSEGWVHSCRTSLSDFRN